MRIRFWLAFLICPSLIWSTTLEQRIQTHAESYIKEKQLPGLAIAYYYQGKEGLISLGHANLKTHTLMNSDTIFDIASLTKVFTSTAIALESLQHKITLDHPITDYLPQVLSSYGAMKKIDFIQLATHTSSLPRVPPKKFQGSEKAVLDFLRNWNPSYPIGTRYVYSNLGFGVLGYAIANMEHQNYEKAIQQLITNPLEMFSTFIIVPENLKARYAQGYSKKGTPLSHPLQLNAWPGGGALKSTSRDLLKFLKANLNIKGPSELLKAMQLAQQGYFRVNNQLTLGLGWQRFLTKDGILILDKNGGLPGFASYIGMIPEKKIGIVILANKNVDVTAFGRKILLDLHKSNE